MVCPFDGCRCTSGSDGDLTVQQHAGSFLGKSPRQWLLHSSPLTPCLIYPRCLVQFPICTFMAFLLRRFCRVGVQLHSRTGMPTAYQWLRCAWQPPWPTARPQAALCLTHYRLHSCQLVWPGGRWMPPAPQLAWARRRKLASRVRQPSPPCSCEQQVLHVTDGDMVGAGTVDEAHCSRECFLGTPFAQPATPLMDEPAAVGYVTCIFAFRINRSDIHIDFRVDKNPCSCTAWRELVRVE